MMASVGPHMKAIVCSIDEGDCSGTLMSLIVRYYVISFLRYTPPALKKSYQQGIEPNICPR
jgi:hypothetical protein